MRGSLLWVVAVILLSLGYFGFVKSCVQPRVQTVPQATKAAPEVVSKVVAQPPMFRMGSTEQKLAVFLNDATAAVDQEKGNWFDFDQVNFATGSATLSDTSMEQLNNVATVMKQFPQAVFKIGGYTDNVGNEEMNKKLSQDRATAVLEQLKKLGIPESQLAGAEGYGSQHAVADNSTEEGRAKNRRMSVRVKSK